MNGLAAAPPSCPGGGHVAAPPGGGYFPALRSDTVVYVAERLELVRWLRDVRRQGCRLFLMTNSAPDYAQTLLDGAFGGRGGWQDLFDLAVFTARKSGTSQGFLSCAKLFCDSSSSSRALTARSIPQRGRRRLCPRLEAS